MSEIRKLIQELCPSGVEFKKLGEICNINRGVRVVRKDLSEQGDYPVFQNSLTPLGYYDRSNYPANTTFIISAGAAGQIGFSKMDFWAADDCICLECPKKLSSRYLYHLLLHHNNYFISRVRKASVPRLSRLAIENFEIPVPPMEVQRKIVEILDNFSNLTAELEAELEERKRQYEYYRNLLLTFSPVANGAVTGGKHQIKDATENRGGQADATWMKMSEIGVMIKGSGIQKADFVDYGLPCIHYGQVHTYYGTFTDKTISFIPQELFERCKKAQTGDLIIATTSEDVEACCKATAWLGQNEVAISGDAHIFRHNQNPRYIAYYFQTECFANQKRKYANGVKVVRVKGENLLKIEIPIPSLEEQQRIVDILDRFETLTTDLQSGLPAEIAARRQQYEYYREQLLTFKRKSA